MTDIYFRRTVSGRTWQPTSDLRWLRVGDEKTLQQGWFCRETGEIEWRDIPVEEPKP